MMDAANNHPPPKHGLVDPSKSRAQYGMFAGLAPSAHPLHDTSFFIDFDVDDAGSETGESCEEFSPVHSSVESFSEHSQTTASPPDVLTPDVQAEDASPNPIFRLKSVRPPGKQDGHFFRATLASTQDFDWRSFEPSQPDEPVPAIPAQFRPSQLTQTQPVKSGLELDDLLDSAPTHEGLDLDDLLESETTQRPLGLQEFLGSAAKQSAGVEEPSEQSADELGAREERSDVHKWTTQQVAAWMYNSGFENSVISAFRTHDINGAILLQLDFEDLCELDISSFGKRRQIWNEINALRNEGSPDPLKASIGGNERGCSEVSELNSPTERTRRPGFDRNGTVTGYRRPSRSTRGQAPHVSPSLEIPRPHRCSKGEKCAKWRQYQRIIAKVDREHGPDTPPSGSFEVAAPRTSPTIPETFQAMNERVSPRTATAQTIPVYTGLPFGVAPQAEDTTVHSDAYSLAPDSPTLEPVSMHPASIDTQHIVQQYQKTGSANTLTPDTPKWDLFPTIPGNLVQGHPPRESSLPGTLPNIAAALPTSTHSSSSSASTIRHGERGPSTSPSMSSSEKLMHRVASPELVPSPLSPALSSLSLSSTTTLVANTRSASAERTLKPKHELRTIPSEYSVPATAIKPIRHAEIKDTLASVTPNTGMERPKLRTVASKDGLAPRRMGDQRTGPQHRGVSPMSRSTEPPKKPLPDVPMKPTATEQHRPVAPAATPDEPSPGPTLNAGVITMPGPAPSAPKSVSANFSRQVTSPPPPRSAASSPLPPSHMSDLYAPSIASRTSNASASRPPRPSVASMASRTSNTSIVSRGSNPSSVSVASRTSNTPSIPSISSVSATPRNASPSLTADCYGPDMLQVGWVRQRRARLWRNEWMPVHLRLTKMQLSIHATAKLDDVPLEVIRMDEYEVGVTTGGMEGNSKIASAIKNWRPGNSSKGSGSSAATVEDAFGFQLVPTAEMMESYHNNVRGSTATARPSALDDTRLHNSMVDGRPSSASSGSTTSTGSGKDDPNSKVPRSYYFAVKTRDDRIEWMRQVMMATAHVQKQQQGLAPPQSDQDSSGEEGRISLDQLLL